MCDNVCIYACMHVCISIMLLVLLLILPLLLALLVLWRFSSATTGHVGTDGRFYLCDTARIFPPEAPSRTFMSLLIPAPKDNEKRNQHKAEDVEMKEYEIHVRRWKDSVKDVLGGDFFTIQIVNGRIAYTGTVRMHVCVLVCMYVCMQCFYVCIVVVHVK